MLNIQSNDPSHSSYSFYIRTVILVDFTSTLAKSVMFYIFTKMARLNQYVISSNLLPCGLAVLPDQVSTGASHGNPARKMGER